MSETVDVVIVGAGIVGLAAAYHLAVHRSIKRIALVDEREPLGLTSRRGTMAYRNWFPGPGDALVHLMNCSIDWLQEIDTLSGHALRLTRGGYVYLSANPAMQATWHTAAADAAQRGVGEFRIHHDSQSYIRSPAGDWTGAPDGVDLITEQELIRALYPQVTPDAAVMLHIRRCGAFDVFALGNWLLRQAQAGGANLLQDRVVSIEPRGGRVERVKLASGVELATGTVVLAPGPLLPECGRLLGLELPIFNELHGKITLRDTARVFPRYGDLILWNDPQALEWSDAERRRLAAAPETQWLLDQFPAGVHYLPKGPASDPYILALWTYDTYESKFDANPTFPEYYAETVLRGLGRVVPQAQVYFGRGRGVLVDGGYYCKTRENRPLIGPLPVQGTFVCGALSGYGVMAALGAGDLVARHVAGAALPTYAPGFLLSRYEDAGYTALLEEWDSRSGQL